MNSQFGEVFLFLTDLAWKSRVTLPVLVTVVFMIMDIRLQIEINLQAGRVAAEEEFDDNSSLDDEEFTTDDDTEED